MFSLSPFMTEEVIELVTFFLLTADVSCLFYVDCVGDLYILLGVFIGSYLFSSFF